jgi:hypothetical protein
MGSLHFGGEGMKFFLLIEVIVLYHTMKPRKKSHNHPLSSDNYLIFYCFYLIGI